MHFHLLQSFLLIYVSMFTKITVSTHSFLQCISLFIYDTNTAKTVVSLSTHIRTTLASPHCCVFYFPCRTNILGRCFVSSYPNPFLSVSCISRWSDHKYLQCWLSKEEFDLRRERELEPFCIFQPQILSHPSRIKLNATWFCILKLVIHEKFVTRVLH